MNDFSHLWNDLPIDERKRLMPYMVERQLRHLEQGKRIAISNHKKYLSEIGKLQKSLQRDLDKYERQLTKGNE